MTAIVDRFKVIDTDTHIIEPYDLWTSRMSVSRWGDLVPHVEWDTAAEDEAWFCGGTRIAPGAGPAFAGYDGYPPDRPNTLAEAQPDTYDLAERVKMMDRDGIHAQVLYPNVAGFGGGRLMALKEPELMLQCVRAYNDYLTDVINEFPDRFLAQMALPFWDVNASVRELERCAALGHTGIVFGSQPEFWGQPALIDRHWDRLWAVAQEADLAINFHIAAGDLGDVTKDPGFGRRTAHARVSLLFFLGNARAIADIIMSGICHRFPRLNFVSVESGVGWIPFALEAMDWQWQNGGVRGEHPEFDLLPSEYFKRQVYSCFWFETGTLRAAIDLIGPNNIMFETDFPHATCLAPGPTGIAKSAREHLETNFSDLSDDTLERILHANAARVYGLTRAH